MVSFTLGTQIIVMTCYEPHAHLTWRPPHIALAHHMLKPIHTASSNCPSLGGYSQEKNWIALQASFFRQALGRLDLINNHIEAGQLIIIPFWPNIGFQGEQGIIHVPVDTILETTAPNTPDNKPENPPEYHCLSPPPPHTFAEVLSGSARNSAPSESSEGTYIKENASRTLSEVLVEINQIVQRINGEINMHFMDLCTMICIKLTLYIVITITIYTNWSLLW